MFHVTVAYPSRTPSWRGIKWTSTGTPYGKFDNPVIYGSAAGYQLLCFLRFTSVRWLPHGVAFARFRCKAADMASLRGACLEFARIRRPDSHIWDRYVNSSQGVTTLLYLYFSRFRISNS